MPDPADTPLIPLGRLPAWYRRHRRDDLPWRHDVTPWGVLVSEVMLQQTPVSRVVDPWLRFMARWPTPEACAAAGLPEILACWHGLGYPRRALNLWRAASEIRAAGWPDTETGLRGLPGVGRYTARALLWIAWEHPASPVPLDVNVSRIAARAGFAREAHEVAPANLESALARVPGSLTPRHLVYALFDVGAAHCRAQPRCDGCPLRAGCAAAAIPGYQPAPRPRRQGQYRGSHRELRGTVLRAFSAEPPQRWREVEAHIAAVLPDVPAALVRAAYEELHREGLLTGLPERA